MIDSAIRFCTPNQPSSLKFNDNDWANFDYSSSQSTCASAIQRASYMRGLPTDSNSVSNDFFEARAPHFWFYTAANAPTCGQPVAMSWVMTLTQADGGQLSFEEIGLPALFACFLAIFLAGGGVHAYVHYGRSPRFEPIIVILFTSSLGAQTVSLLLNLVRYGVLSSTGEDSLFCSVAAGLTRAGASVLLWIVCGLAATGYGITTARLFQPANAVAVSILFVAVVIYVAGLAWMVTAYDPASTSSQTSAWPFVTVTVLSVLYAAWFVWALRRTLLREAHTLKREVLWRLAVALGSSFAVMPLAGIVGAMVYPTESTRVVYGIDTACIAVVYAAGCWALWPPHVRDAFKTYDASGTALHSLDDDYFLDQGLPDISALSKPGQALAGIDIAYEALPSHGTGRA